MRRTNCLAPVLLVLTAGLIGCGSKGQATLPSDLNQPLPKVATSGGEKAPPKKAQGAGGNAVAD